MLKPYRVTYEFYYNGLLENRGADICLREEPLEKEISSTDFDKLWRLRKEFPSIVPWSAYEGKKGRSLGRWDEFHRVVHEWKSDIKPWKVVARSEETTIAMKRLMEFDSDKVIQYLKERGMTVCPMNF